MSGPSKWSLGGDAPEPARFEEPESPSEAEKAEDDSEQPKAKKTAQKRS